MGTSIPERKLQMILVINGSPKPKGNLERMLHKIASDTAIEYEIVDLVKLDIRPCIGCVKCAKTLRCVVKDDMTPLYDKIVESDAFLVGGVNYFSHVNGFTRVFLERMFPLHHRHPPVLGKPAGAVAVGWNDAAVAVNEIAAHLSSYFKFNVVGTAVFNSKTPPCFRCGFGTECTYGAPARWMTPAEFKNFSEITPDMVHHFEDYPDVVFACGQLAEKLKGAIADSPA
jgi:multimeric flavodoxin WrbA